MRLFALPGVLFLRLRKAVLYLYFLANDVAGLLAHAMLVPLRLRASERAIFWKNFLHHIYLGGVSTLQAVVLLGLIFGAIILLVVLSAFSDAPVEAVLGRVYAIGFLQIITPILISFVVTACYTPAVCYQVADMRLNGEFELLLTTGANPVVFIFSPIFYAVVFILSAHIIFFTAALLTGSYVVSLLWPGLNFRLLVDVFYSAIDIPDFMVLTYKIFVLSVAIALFPLRESLHEDPYHARIPDLITRAAKNIILFIAISEISLALFLYT